MSTGRAEPFHFAAPDGRVFSVEPPTRGRFRAAIALEATDFGVGVGNAASRRAVQLAALIGPQLAALRDGRPEGTVDSASILRTLCPPAELELFCAVAAHGLAQSPGTAAPRASHLTLEERLERYDADTLTLACHLRRAPSEVEASMGFAESLSLLEAIYDERRDRARFEAALHGLKLND